MTRAIVGFSSADHALSRWLEPGFGHCFCAVLAGGLWVSVEGLSDTLLPAVAGDAWLDLAGQWQAAGYTVIATHVRPRRPSRLRLAPFTCVEVVKRTLNIDAALVITPHQLYRHLMENDMGGSSPKTTQQTIPTAPVEETATIDTEEEKVKREAARRGGRPATILTSGLGVPGSADVSKKSLLGS